MEFYPYLKVTHISLALLSLAGFVWRLGLMWRGSVLLSQPWVRRLPHLNDTLLLTLGLLLLWLGPWSLAGSGWLQLKLLMLLVYIVLGVVALRRGHFARSSRVVAGGAAISVYLVMLWLAHFKPF